jgi:hypothetical protein
MLRVTWQGEIPDAAFDDARAHIVVFEAPPESLIIERQRIAYLRPDLRRLCSKMHLTVFYKALEMTIFSPGEQQRSARNPSNRYLAFFDILCG